MGSFEDALNEAEKLTDLELESRIMTMVKISKADLELYFPTHVDRVQLFEFMKIVRSAADENTKRQVIINRIGSFVGVIVQLARLVM